MITVALAGKPNAGKSTFFTAATMDEVDVGNYPFTTIDPNRGVAHVRTECPCLDLDSRCDNDRCRDGKRYVPVELIDVAGLVPGAHEGRGLGNQFLDELTNADVILNVVDAAGATNAEGDPVDVGTHDPLEEVDFIEEEMDRWLVGIVDRNWEAVERKSRSPDFDIDDALTDMLTGFGATEHDVAAVLRNFAYPPDPKNWTDEHRETLARAVRRRTKPLVLVANKADIAPEANLERLQSVDRPVIPASAEGELALRRGASGGVIAYDPGDETFDITGEVTPAQESGLDSVADLMAENGGTGVQTALDRAVYELLDMITAYPVQDPGKWTDGQGNVLPDAHLLPRGSTPRGLAAEIHSDIADGYLHAIDARSGRRISDEYELSEGDVIKIVSTAT